MIEKSQNRMTMSQNRVLSHNFQISEENDFSIQLSENDDSVLPLIQDKFKNKGKQTLNNKVRNLEIGNTTWRSMGDKNLFL